MDRLVTRSAALAGSILAACLVAGCSDDDGGTPGTLPPASSQPASGGHPEVPKVANPLNVDPFLGDPCRLVSPEALAGIGAMKPGVPDVDSPEAKELIGPSCDWAPQSAGPDFSVAIHTVARDRGGQGLVDLYKNVEGGLGGFIEKTDVPGYPGYPAVYSDRTDNRAGGDCPMTIGVADNLTIAITMHDDANPANACPAAQKVATAVLDTLTKGA